jgi:hypothetical protein
VLSLLQAHPWSRYMRSLWLVLAGFTVLCSGATQRAAAANHQLTVSPENLDFQTVAIGQQATLTFHLRNTGATALNIYSVSASRSEFQIAGPSVPISVAPSDSVDFKIIFEPIAAGKTSALLEIRSSAEAMQSYTLTGTGKEVFAVLQLSPSSLNFGSQELNSVSTKKITVRNTGDVPVAISGVTVMGSGFGFANVSPGLSLAPREQTVLQVSFRPTSSEVASGKVMILSKNLPAAATLPLAGSGVSVSRAASLPVEIETRERPSTASSESVGAVTGESSGSDAAVAEGAAMESSPAGVLGAGTGRASTGSSAGLTNAAVAARATTGSSSAATSTATSTATSAATTSATSSATAATNSLADGKSASSTMRAAVAAAVSSPSVYVQWAPSASAVVGYKVYRGTVSGGPYVSQTPSVVASLNYTDTGVAAGSNYFYVVTSVDSAGAESAFSNQASISVPSGTTTPPPVTVPPPPTTPPPTTSPSTLVPSSVTSGIVMNGSAALSGTRMRLTSAQAYLTGTGWFKTPVNVQSFTNDFTFQMANSTSNSAGNGIAFVIQNTGTQAMGPTGGGLGYGPDNTSHPSASSQTPIGKSVAIKFDTVNNAGEGSDSTGIYKNGASPTVPAVALGNGVNLKSGDVFQVHMSYNGTTLTMTITDTANASQTFTTSWSIDIPGTVGGSTAYVGFTGATGTSMANQDIITWTYSNSNTPTAAAKAPIVYRTTAMPAVSSGPTFRTFAYAGFPDGTGTILDATAPGDSVTFSVNVAAAGTYDVTLSYKQANNHGISQLSINGTSVGAPLDQYVPTQAYASFDFGKFTFPTAGSYAFKFAILGKDAKAVSYAEAFDDLTLTPQ